VDGARVAGTYADFTEGLTLIPGSGGQFEVMVNASWFFRRRAKDGTGDQGIEGSHHRYLEGRPFWTMA